MRRGRRHRIPRGSFEINFISYEDGQFVNGQIFYLILYFCHRCRLGSVGVVVVMGLSSSSSSSSPLLPLCVNHHVPIHFLLPSNKQTTNIFKTRNKQSSLIAHKARRKELLHFIVGGARLVYLPSSYALLTIVYHECLPWCDCLFEVLIFIYMECNIIYTNIK